jgi:hypothetical protein
MEQMTTVAKKTTIVKGDTNLDPMSGEPGAHPVGVGSGAAGGGIAGAVIGAAVGGPIGAGVGVVVGAVAGGYAGKSAAEVINPTAEHEFWRIEFLKRPYFTPGSPYEQFGPAYQYGWESYSTLGTKGKTFKEIETELRRDWENRRGQSKLSWERAKGATHDAWQRVAKAACGDNCR